MSRAATREAIADALDDVAGIHGYPSRPASFGEGDGWPQWAGSERFAGSAFYQSWNVLIVLPSVDVDADAYADSHGDLITDALGAVMFVTALRPAVIATEGGDVYALLVEGRTE